MCLRQSLLSTVRHLPHTKSIQTRTLFISQLNHPSRSKLSVSGDADGLRWEMTKNMKKTLPSPNMLWAYSEYAKDRGTEEVPSGDFLEWLFYERNPRNAHLKINEKGIVVTK